MTAPLSFFPTLIYRAPLGGDPALIDALARSARSVAEDDEAGQAWCEAHDYIGYTSYGSLTDLAWRDPAFASAQQLLDGHAARFVEALDYDLEGRALTLDTIWINILEPGGTHSGHIHPRSVLSGTLYLEVPEGAAPLKVEDPRLGLMMAAPPRKAGSPLRQFQTLQPQRGDVLLWESWLRHEVPVNLSEEDRVSVSFNYRW